jgi:hypothetical protein
LKCPEEEELRLLPTLLYKHEAMAFISSTERGKKTKWWAPGVLPAWTSKWLNPKRALELPESQTPVPRFPRLLVTNRFVLIGASSKLCPLVQRAETSLKANSFHRRRNQPNSVMASSRPQPHPIIKRIVKKTRKRREQVCPEWCKQSLWNVPVITYLVKQSTVLVHRMMWLSSMISHDDIPWVGVLKIVFQH